MADSGPRLARASRAAVARRLPARRPSAGTAAVAGIVVGLLACAPPPTAAVRTVGAPFGAGATAAAEVTAPVVGLLALAAWGLAGWLLVATALTAWTRLPGLAGRVGGTLLRRIAPAAVRRVLEIALGLTVVTGVVAGPASPSYGGAGTGPAAPPGTAVTTTPPLDWPTVPAAEPADTEQVVVAPGDTLWSLAERSLGDRGTPARIAATWPAWWTANRDVIGDDPDLLQPGAVLTPPAQT